MELMKAAPLSFQARSSDWTRSSKIVLNSLLYSSSPLFSDIKMSNLSISSLSTCLKLPRALCSHSIMSKKMWRVAFLSSISGTSVTFRKGPTIDGMKCNLHSPSWDHMDRIWKPMRTLMSPYFSMIFSFFTSEKCSNWRGFCVK
jgi:hypothetical protein